MFLMLMVLNATMMVAFALLAVAFYGLLPKVPKSRASVNSLPFVSIVVPARNEEKKIARCIESLANQDYPHFEIVVIDDRSTDRTGEIIEEFSRRYSSVRALHGSDTPSGWIGKCNALVQAVKHASGEYLIFTDADTCHHKNSIADAVNYAQSKNLDLLSFVPLQELGSFWERAIMPVMLGSFVCGDPFHKVNDPKSQRAYAYGQYTLVKRQAYIASGGHQAIRDEILEDHALAKKIKEMGFKIFAADGRRLYQVRMYTDLPSLWHGWTKNLYSLINCRLFNLALVVLLINSCLFLPFVWFSQICFTWLTQGVKPGLEFEAVICLVQFAALASWRARTGSHYIGGKWYDFFLLPAGALACTSLFVHAAYLVLSGSQVNWKGRAYVVSREKTIRRKAETMPATPSAVGPVGTITQAQVVVAPANDYAIINSPPDIL